MSTTDNKGISRLKFLKLTSFAGIGALLKGQPAIAYFADQLSMSIDELMNASVCCELLRSADLLNQRYFFFNAKVAGRYLKKKDVRFPMFVYVQIPVQHVDEPLLPEHAYKERKDFKDQASFAGYNSFLAFHSIDKEVEILLKPQHLLQWGSNFKMISIDDFAKSTANGRIEYKKVLEDLKNEITTDKELNYRSRFSNTLNDNNNRWPLTFFAVPYKMYLSPISHPINDPGRNEYTRQLGEYIFTSNNELATEYIKGKVSIIKPWSNELKFRNIKGILMSPRFKVISYLCANDNDRAFDLLPGPIHRYDLNGLTMRPEYDRDIISDLFRISSLGINANLDYENADPTDNHALIAYKHRIRYARTNYVSVTYRAVDYFTSLKLKISIVGERDYLHGVSFIPKRYFVNYANEHFDDEGYMVFDTPIVISGIHCKKIKPLSKGGYFFPNTVPDVGSKVLAVDDPLARSQGGYQPGRLLNFDYECVDKDGKIFKKKLKMFAILPETYKLVSGKYEFYNNGTLEKTYNAPADIDIAHIGQLDPGRLKRHVDAGYKPPCAPNSNTYVFDLEKLFSKKEATALDIILSKLREHTIIHKIVFSSTHKEEITYARIAGLKNKQGPDAIKNDSSAATFNTDSILMGSVRNTTLYSLPDDTDIFLQKLPLIPRLIIANLIISQIDSIEGKSKLREVCYATDYVNGKVEIDEHDPNNNAHLLFELVEPIDDFFADNYKRSGAASNPGIEISHVSVLDQGISYNRTHNQLAIGAKSLASAPSIPSTSVFKPLKAELFGIPLTKIIAASLQIADIPVFAYIQQAEDAIAKIEMLLNNYRTIVEKWIGKYEQAKRIIETLPNSIKDLESQLKKLATGQAKAWIDSIIEQSQAYEYYLQLSNTYNRYAVQFDTYKNDILGKIKLALNNIHDLDAAISAFVTKPDLANLKALTDELSKNKMPVDEYKESIKIYLVNKYSKDTTKVIETLHQQLPKLQEQLDVTAQQYYDIVLHAVHEASSFMFEMILAYERNAKRALDDARNLTIEYAAKYKDEIEFLIKFYRLIKVVEKYSRIYRNINTESYIQLAHKYGIDIPPIQLESVNKIKDGLVNELKAEVKKLEAQTRNSIKESLKPAFEANVKKLTDSITQDVFSRYNEVAAGFEKILLETLKTMFIGIYELDKQYNTILSEIEKNKQLLKNAEDEIKKTGKNILENAQKELEAQQAKLITYVNNREEYQRVLSAISDIQALINAIQEVSKQRLEYHSTIDTFNAATFAGVITFSPNRNGAKTLLKVDVFYEIEFDISQIGSLPTIKKQSYLTDSELTNFSISFLQIIFIDFDRVKFISGSDVKDDFIVNIRNVQFGGPLNFIDAFKQYLQNIDRNLVFDINAEGASVGYGFSIPDFPAGYFNFFNLSLSALLTLPFDARKSLQLCFGFGSDLNKFGITVCGIFGGQGYFNLIAEPKRGIVGMILVLEFGAIFNLNIGVAWGTAYLVGGIYIKRYNGNIELRGYILCVGRLNILGIFSASLTFYLGLHGDGHVLEGSCAIKVSKKITPWFEISVRCTLTKVIQGAKTSDSQKATRLETDIVESLQRKGFVILATNLNDKYIDADTKLYLNIANPSLPDKGKINILLLDSKDKAVIDHNYDIKVVGNQPTISMSIDNNKLHTDEPYKAYVEIGGTKVLLGNISKHKRTPDRCGNKLDKNVITAREYYRSYYKKTKV